MFEGVGERDQFRFGPRGAEERDPDGQPMHVTGRNCDMRITGDGGQSRAAVAGAIAVDEIGEPRWNATRRNQSVEFVFLQGRIDSLLARELVIFSKRIQVNFRR